MWMQMTGASIILFPLILDSSVYLQIRCFLGYISAREEVGLPIHKQFTIVLLGPLFLKLFGNHIGLISSWWLVKRIYHFFYWAFSDFDSCSTTDVVLIENIYCDFDSCSTTDLILIENIYVDDEDIELDMVLKFIRLSKQQPCLRFNYEY